MKRIDVAEMIIEAKLKKGLKWSDIAQTVGHSKEWTTAALLGQMTLTQEEAKKIGGATRFARCCGCFVAGRAVQGRFAYAGAHRSADLSIL